MFYNCGRGPNNQKGQNSTNTNNPPTSTLLPRNKNKHNESKKL